MNALMNDIENLTNCEKLERWFTNHDRLSVRDAVHELGISANSVSGGIDQLRKKGYVISSEHVMSCTNKFDPNRESKKYRVYYLEGKK